MVSLGLLVSLVALLFLKAPIPVAMGTSVLVACWLGDYPIHILAQGVIEGSMTWSLLSIFFFIMAGNIMNACGIAERIFSFARACVGHWKGGLAHVNVLCSMIFAGISGSAAADCAALGPIEIKAMTDSGYDLKYSTGVTLASSMLGPIIPPSVPFILYGVIANVSIAKLFLAGIGPGIVIGVALMLQCAWIAHRHPHKFPMGERIPMRDRFAVFKTSIWALLAPVIILFGMTTGFISPTEAGVVAVLYSLALGLAYGTLNRKTLWNVIVSSMFTAANSLILFGIASTMSYILTLERTPVLLAEYVLSLTSNKWVILVLVNALILMLGTITTAASIIILLTPILVPLMQQIGVDLVQLGVILAFGVTIGIATPPVGIGLFVLSDVTKQSVEDVVKGVAPFLPILFVLLFLLSFVPQISTWLPSVLLPY